MDQTTTSPGATSTPDQARQAAATAADQAKQVGGTAAGAATEVAGTAKEQAAQVAGTAAEQAKDVASTATSQAADVATEAKEQAKAVGTDIVQQARTVVGEARGQLSTTAGEQTAKASEALRTVQQQLRALADGRVHEAGPVADYAAQAATRFATLADRIDDRGVEGMIDDVRRFARRKPGTFLLAAGAAGLGVGLLLRGAKAASSAEEDRSVTGPAMWDALPAAQMPPVDAADLVAPDVIPVAPTSPGMGGLAGGSGTAVGGTFGDGAISNGPLGPTSGGEPSL